MTHIHTSSTGIFRLLNLLVKGTAATWRNDAKSPTRRAQEKKLLLSYAFAGANIKININIRTTDFQSLFFLTPLSGKKKEEAWKIIEQ